MKWDKTVHFCSKNILVFGWQLILADGTIQCDQERVRTLLAMQRPTTKKSARSYVGALNFISDAMPKCKLILKPIYQQCGNSTKKFTWDSECETAFEQVKTELSKLVILLVPDPTRNFFHSV